MRMAIKVSLNPPYREWLSHRQRLLCALNAGELDANFVVRLLSDGCALKHGGVEGKSVGEIEEEEFVDPFCKDVGVGVGHGVGARLLESGAGEDVVVR